MLSHLFGPESDVLEEEEEPTLPPDIHDAAVAFLSDQNRRFLLNRAEEALAAAAQKATDSDCTFAEFFTPPRIANEAPRYGFYCVAFEIVSTAGRLCPSRVSLISGTSTRRWSLSSRSTVHLAPISPVFSNVRPCTSARTPRPTTEAFEKLSTALPCVSRECSGKSSMAGATSSRAATHRGLGPLRRSWRFSTISAGRFRYQAVPWAPMTRSLSSLSARSGGSARTVPCWRTPSHCFTARTRAVPTIVSTNRSRARLAVSRGVCSHRSTR